MAKVDAGGKPAKGEHKAGRVEAFPAKKARKKAEDLGGLTDLNDVFAAFQDPKQEWRRLVAELVGTFFLVLVAAGGGRAGPHGHGSDHGAREDLGSSFESWGEHCVRSSRRFPVEEGSRLPGGPTAGGDLGRTVVDRGRGGLLLTRIHLRR